MTERKRFYKEFIKQSQLESTCSSEDDPCVSEDDDSDRDPGWEPDFVQKRDRFLSIGPKPKKQSRSEPGCSHWTPIPDIPIAPD